MPEGRVQLHKNPYRKIQRAQECATQDILKFEKIANGRWPRPKMDVTTMALLSSIDLVRYNQLPARLEEISSSQELLPMAEIMRKYIFGSTSLFSRGLCGERGTGGSLQQQGSCRDWVHSSIGGMQVACKSIKEMSDYMTVLARAEAPRDPTAIEPPSDENDIAGIMSRKMSVNFGNRFRKDKKRAHANHSKDGTTTSIAMTNSSAISLVSSSSSDYNFLEIEGFAGIVAATSIDRTTGESGKVSGGVDDVLKEVKNFYMDTPNPYMIDRGDAISDTTPVTVLFDDAAVSFSDYSDSTKPIEDDSLSSPWKKQAMGRDNSTTPNSITAVEGGPSGSIVWVKCFSKRQNRNYWFNESTGESVWIDPNS
jgi:hypothetical protein